MTSNRMCAWETNEPFCSCVTPLQHFHAVTDAGSVPFDAFHNADGSNGRIV